MVNGKVKGERGSSGSVVRVAGGQVLQVLHTTYR